MNLSPYIHKFKQLSHIKNIFIVTANPTLGRWKINDNQSIKASLANMDCCGDNHCGTPHNYSEAINHYSKNTKTQ